MAEASASIWCDCCEKQVRAIRPRPNHVLHFLITVLTCGWWIFIWLIMGLNAMMGGWRCTACGQYNRAHRIGARITSAVVLGTGAFLTALWVVVIVAGPTPTPPKRNHPVPLSGRPPSTEQPQSIQPDAAEVAETLPVLDRPEAQEEADEPERVPSEPIEPKEPVNGTPAVAEKTVPPFPLSHNYRTWTDTTGGFSVEAEFAGAGFGKVKLRKRDGSQISVRLDRLSEADRQWIADRPRD